MFWMYHRPNGTVTLFTHPSDLRQIKPEMLGQIWGAFPLCPDGVDY